jgi:hypothetical protein
MHPLDGPKLKLDRAAYHLQTLNDFICTWQNAKPLTVSGHHEADKAVYVYRLEIPPIQGGGAIIIGDILHNLRSALDHIAWQLALLSTPSPHDKTEFPIFWQNDNRTNGIIKRLLQNVPDDARKVIEALQPYATPNPRTHPLWLLQELSNRDKHRLLTLTGAQWRFDMLAGMAWDWLNDYTVDITIPSLNEQFPPPIPEIHCDCLIITDKEETHWRIDVLAAIHEFVRDNVIPRFVGFFP